MHPVVGRAAEGQDVAGHCIVQDCVPAHRIRARAARPRGHRRVTVRIVPVHGAAGARLRFCRYGSVNKNVSSCLYTLESATRRRTAENLDLQTGTYDHKGAHLSLLGPACSTRQIWHHAITRLAHIPTHMRAYGLSLACNCVLSQSFPLLRPSDELHSGARLKDGGVFPTEQPGVGVLKVRDHIGGVHGGYRAAADLPPAGRTGPHLPRSSWTVDVLSSSGSRLARAAACVDADHTRRQLSSYGAGIDLDHGKHMDPDLTPRHSCR